MSAAHTAGPWSVDIDTRNDREGAEYVAGYNILSATAEVVGCEGIIPGPTAEADARLIAAAPDLLAALRWFIDDIDGLHTPMVGFDRNVEDARAAIAKAEARP